MKTLFLILIVLPLAVPAAAQPVVGVYTDAAGLGDCNLQEALYTIQSVWLVQTGPDAQGSRLRFTTGWNATVIAVAFPILYIANPDIFAGDFVPYAGCRTMPYAMARIDFMSFAATPQCTAELHVGPDPAAASGEIEVTDCSGNVVYAQSPAPYVVVNGNATCPCIVDPVAAEPSTWGKVKSFYQ
jgi:hypothetical protein